MFHVKHPDRFLTTWEGEITGQESGPEEGEVTLTVTVTHPQGRSGRRIHVTIHRDALADLLDLAE